MDGCSNPFAAHQQECCQNCIESVLYRLQTGKETSDGLCETGLQLKNFKHDMAASTVHPRTVHLFSAAEASCGFTKSFSRSERLINCVQERLDQRHKATSALINVAQAVWHTEYITIPSNPACIRNASNQTRMLIMVLPNVRNECATSAARGQSAAANVRLWQLVQEKLVEQVVGNLVIYSDTPSALSRQCNRKCVRL